MHCPPGRGPSRIAAGRLNPDLKSDESLAYGAAVARFLRRFYEPVDGPDAAARCAAMLGEDLRFSILFSTPDG